MMNNQPLSSDYIASVIANRLAVERRERDAARRARAAALRSGAPGAVFTNWCVSDRD